MLKGSSVLLALLLAACEIQPSNDVPAAAPPEPVRLEPPAPPPTAPATPVPAPSPPVLPEGVSYAGGDGSSISRAVVVRGVSGTRASTRAEYAFLRNRYPGFRRKDQQLIRSGGRYYDALSFDLPNGESKTVYFDVTGTFGKR
jgi:hypothetical protein